VRTIPQIRVRLHELANELDIQELHDLAEETKRRAPLRPRVKAKYPMLTQAQQAEIRDYAWANADQGVREISIKFNTSIGRVSEAISGMREAA
jgi:hypothetical protein